MVLSRKINKFLRLKRHFLQIFETKTAFLYKFPRLKPHSFHKFPQSWKLHIPFRHNCKYQPSALSFTCQCPPLSGPTRTRTPFFLNFPIYSRTVTKPMPISSATCFCGRKSGLRAELPKHQEIVDSWCFSARCLVGMIDSHSTKTQLNRLILQDRQFHKSMAIQT